jgi:hypothetical protein
VHEAGAVEIVRKGNEVLVQTGVERVVALPAIAGPTSR